MGFVLRSVKFMFAFSGFLIYSEDYANALDCFYLEQIRIRYAGVKISFVSELEQSVKCFSFSNLSTFFSGGGPLFVLLNITI